MARKHKLAAALLAVGCIQSGSVWALGLGEISLESFLNEPLNAKVELLNTGDLQEDQIRVRLATRDDFDRLGVDRSYFLTGIKFSVEVDENGSGYIKLRSDDPVLEPYLDLIIETRWPSGRLLREYTVLVDPPAFSSSAQVVSARERVESIEGAPGQTAKKTEAGNGTRVDVGSKSGLAPGEMPERDYSAGTEGRPSAGSKYMIHRDETLWEIAAAAHPEGVSVHQTMLDIQRLNPDAFIDGNINLIKAGYIVYLPSAQDISSSDLPAALAEVKQQNEDWRAGRSSTSDTASSGSTGPSLRISADPEESASATEAVGSNTAAGRVALENLERSERENTELQGRVDALSEQVSTLESIVSVKDEQIAALQDALRAANGNASVVLPGDNLSDAGQAATSDTDSFDEKDDDFNSETSVSTAEAGGQLDLSTETTADTRTAVTENTSPAARTDSTPSETQIASRPPQAQESFFSRYRMPILGSLAAVILGLFLWHRRRSDDEEFELDGGSDVFAGVELPEEGVELESDGQSEFVVDNSEADQNEQATHGYGERRHDEYASDMDAGDALAEADIYVAYGRYPQAIELLKSAVVSEPDNTAYRFRLLELCSHAGRRQEAVEQLEALRGLGDGALVRRGEELLGASSGDNYSGGANTSYEAPPVTEIVSPVSNALDSLPSDPADFEVAPDFDDSENSADGFSELEIEGENYADLADDLELSEDFESAIEEELEDDDGELVFATEGSPMSTKLDLARAYIDMGDQDGARQILEEVVLEGDSQDQIDEAKSLLERLDD